jgi:hypothetical protein
VRVPTVVSKASLASGLIYSYTKDDPASSDPWYFTALDIRDGHVVYKQLAGSGFGFNNNYAPVTLGPDGTAYVGAIGGLVAVRDATPPNLPPPAPPAAAIGLLRLRVKARVLTSGKLRISIVGSLSAVDRVIYRVGRVLARSSRPPFTVTVAAPALLSARRGHAVRVRVRARVYLTTGSARTLLAIVKALPPGRARTAG